MTTCSNCGRGIEKLPEGVAIPEPPYEMLDLQYDPETKVMVMTTKVAHAYCKVCSASVGVTLEQYLRRVAKPKPKTKAKTPKPAPGPKPAQ